MNGEQMVVVVPSGDFKHRKAKQSGRDWYVQRAGLQGRDGLAEPFEMWHQSQDGILKAGQYTVQCERAYVNDKRLVLVPRLVPVVGK